MKTIQEVAEEIENYVDYVSILQLISKEMNAGLSASPLLNFKDALWHYRVCYEVAQQESDIYRYIYNIYSIEEHLYRGLKDITIYIICVLKQRMSKFIALNASSYKKKAKLRFLLHDLKSLEINIRNDQGEYPLPMIEESIAILQEIYCRATAACRELGVERSVIRGL